MSGEESTPRSQWSTRPKNPTRRGAGTALLVQQAAPSCAILLYSLPSYGRGLGRVGWLLLLATSCPEGIITHWAENMVVNSKKLLQVTGTPRTGECHSCGECCKVVNITVVRDTTIQQHGSLKELKLYLSYRGIRVVGEDKPGNQLHYSMDVACSELTADNRCRVHDSPLKPLICLRFPSSKEDVEDIANCGYSFSH